MVLSMHGLPIPSFSFLQSTKKDAAIFFLHLLEMFFNGASKFTCLLFFVYHTIWFVVANPAATPRNISRNSNYLHNILLRRDYCLTRFPPLPVSAVPLHRGYKPPPVKKAAFLQAVQNLRIPDSSRQSENRSCDFEDDALGCSLLILSGGSYSLTTSTST